MHLTMVTFFEKMLLQKTHSLFLCFNLKKNIYIKKILT